MAYLDPEFSPLPEGWSAKELSDVVEIHNTKRQPLNGREREGRKGSYPYCGANGVVDYIDDYRFDGEYVLIAEDGGYWGKHQPSSYIMRSKFWVNNHAHVVCAIPTETTNTFFSNIVNYLNIDPFIGGDARGKLTKAILTQLAIPLPPLPEQKKIAHILSTVQRAIEAQERIIQTTTELKKALMHKLFTEGLRNEPQKQTEIGPVPEGWEMVEIGDLGKCVTGSTPKTKVASFYDPPSEDFIAPADLGARRYVYDSEKKISPEGMATIRPIPKDAVMCVCIGSSIGKVGMSYREESATNQQINSIICKKGRDPEFVYYLLSYRWECWKSFATFGPVPILSKGRFTSIKVAIPSSIEEQQVIAKPLVALETKVEVAEKKVAALHDLFRTLLHELMTAKIRVLDFDFTA